MSHFHLQSLAKAGQRLQDPGRTGLLHPGVSPSACQGRTAPRRGWDPAHGDIWVPTGLCCCREGNASPSVNVIWNWKQCSYLPPPCQPFPLPSLLSARGSRQGGQRLQLAVSAQGTWRSPGCSTQARTSLMKICNESWGTRGSFALLLAPSSSLSIPPSGVGGCDENTLAEPPESWLSACLRRDGKISHSWLQGARVTPAAVRSGLKHRANSLAAHGKVLQTLRVQQLQEFFASVSFWYL